MIDTTFERFLNMMSKAQKIRKYLGLEIAELDQLKKDTRERY